jgi:hypothetical protein
MVRTHHAKIPSGLASTCIQYQIQPFGGHCVVFVVKKKTPPMWFPHGFDRKEKNSIAKVKKSHGDYLVVLVTSNKKNKNHKKKTTWWSLGDSDCEEKNVIKQKNHLWPSIGFKKKDFLSHKNTTW